MYYSGKGLIMVVPCLTCHNRGEYKYEYDEKRRFFDYFLTCKCGVEIPQPAPKEGFVCEKYDSMLNYAAPKTRSECAVEIRHD